jgi:hypothetical protein
MGYVVRPRNFWPHVSIGGAIVLFGILFWLAQPKGSDAQQISHVLEGATAASRAGKAGSTLDLLSHAFEVDGSHPEASDVADAIRRYRPDIEVQASSLSVVGDEGEMKAKVHVRGTFLGAGFDTNLEGVKLTFSREPGLSFGFIPVRVWRLKRIDLAGGWPHDSELSGWIRGV